MMHLSRFCEELILWNTNEFRFVEMDDGFATGSSIMPQKKNPDVAELIRGKTGRVYGDLMALLTVMKGIPLAYNKDMQEDKEAFFDARDTLVKGLTVFTAMLKTVTFRKDVMEKGASGGFTNATDCADYLVRKGVPFRDAHRVVGELVAHCLNENEGAAGSEPGGAAALPSGLWGGCVRGPEHDRLRGKEKDPRRAGAGDGAGGHRQRPGPLEK